MINIHNNMKTPFYVLNIDRFNINLESFENAFASSKYKLRPAYSVKTNYSKSILCAAASKSWFGEVVSEDEYWLARNFFEPGKIIINGPIKSEDLLITASIRGDIVNLESTRDIELVGTVSKQFLNPLKCCLRIRVSEASRFGLNVQAEKLKDMVLGLLKSENVTLIGVHCHEPNRSLEEFRKRCRYLVKIFNEISSITPLEFINFGGGFYGKFSEFTKLEFGVAAVDWHEYASELKGILDEYNISNVTICMEPGTAVVSDVGHYFCKILEIQNVGGKVVANTDGSILHTSPNSKLMRRPSFLHQVEGNKNTLVECDPNSTDLVELMGYTCIENDRFGVVDGKINVGNIVHFENVGSYSIVMNAPFITRPPIVWSYRNQELSVERKLEGSKDFFEGLGFEI